MPNDFRFHSSQPDLRSTTTADAMSKTPADSASAFDPKAWIVPGVVTCVLVAAVVSYPRAAEVNAAAGSPYYSKAAREALAGLQSPAEQQALPAATPALPAGLSPAEHYWCEQCKAYHKRQPGTVSQAGAAQVPAAQVPAAGAAAPPLAAAAIPPLPQGLDPADYYWCANCKVYHSRSNPQVNVAGAVAADPPSPEPMLGIPPSLARPIEPPPSQE
jgi:hypothetical protein